MTKPKIPMKRVPSNKRLSKDSIYRNMYETILHELTIREGTMAAQRENTCIEEEASIITKMTIGHVLECIDKEWKG